MAKEACRIINPAIFRLHKSTEDYLKAIHFSAQVTDVGNKFYLSINSWAKNTSKTIEYEIDKAHKELMEKIMFKHLSIGAQKLLGELCNNPIVSESFCEHETKNSNSSTIQELLDLKLIEKRMQKESQGVCVYVCNLTMNLLNQLEKVIIQSN